MDKAKRLATGLLVAGLGNGIAAVLAITVSDRPVLWQVGRVVGTAGFLLAAAGAEAFADGRRDPRFGYGLLLVFVEMVLVSASVLDPFGIDTAALVLATAAMLDPAVVALPVRGRPLARTAAARVALGFFLFSAIEAVLFVRFGAGAWLFGSPHAVWAIGLWLAARASWDLRSPEAKPL
ncbi:MAG: hypothetical protein ACT4PT_12900 [Methanobacteriota archaeon]